MTNLTVVINTGTVDVVYPTADWIAMVLASDSIIFSNGSDVVADGQPIPSDSALNQAGIVISIVDLVVPHYFLADISEDLLKEIHLAGNQNKRYVFGFNFDGPTASEPVLELWDDATYSTVNLDSLGAGDPESSWWRGIVTTNGAPGSNWVGSKLAGASETHFLLLNGGNGALTGAATLYCNLKVIVPANYTSAGADKPVFAIKYTTN
jgi:hypothetical protein